MNIVDALRQLYGSANITVEGFWAIVDTAIPETTANLMTRAQLISHWHEDQTRAAMFFAHSLIPDIEITLKSSSDGAIATAHDGVERDFSAPTPAQAIIRSVLSCLVGRGEPIMTRYNPNT